MVSIHFDDRNLRKAFTAYMAVTSRDARTTLEVKAAMLVSGGKGVQGLYQEARKHAPETRAEIRALARKPWKIKRKRGSAMAEIARRLRYAGFVQSTGWFNKRYGTPRKDGSVPIRQVANPRGVVVSRLSGPKMFISITNRTPRAGEFASKTGYVQRAINNITADMMKYVERKLQESAQRFSKR